LIPATRYLLLVSLHLPLLPFLTFRFHVNLITVPSSPEWKRPQRKNAGDKNMFAVWRGAGIQPTRV
jgi:hypothetical protein